ncbi:ATP-grasp fold amidoligase family protein [Acetobacterium wieringae]|uniref:ATP-grasp fold amidoligase family protein n=1 Tax=Acetobacterium wieringae TaxID=52694 RepID=UPI003157F9E8
MRNRTKFEKAIQTPGRFFMNLIYRFPAISKKIDDKEYLKFIYFFCFWKKLNLENPETFSEKLQWLKLYDRRDIYTKIVDKYLVKDYVENFIGLEYVIPTLGVWDRFEDIDFDALPNQFVLKCTHDSGGLVICKDKKELNIEMAKRKINKCLMRNFYYLGREWPYKNVIPRIIAEPFISDKNGELKDYKFFCFSGTPRMLFIASDREIDTRFDFFDANFKHLPFTNGHANSEKSLEYPQQFEMMKRLAAILSKNFPQIRVDFYNVDGKIYFGELTLFHFSGFVPYEPNFWDIEIGKWVELPQNRGLEGNGND